MCIAIMLRRALVLSAGLKSARIGAPTVNHHNPDSALHRVAAKLLTNRALQLFNSATRTHSSPVQGRLCTDRAERLVTLLTLCEGRDYCAAEIEITARTGRCRREPQDRPTTSECRKNVAVMLLLNLYRRDRNRADLSLDK